MKAESLWQQWSQGQCNIVDHRKLVSVINNDKNKQRWVCCWTSWGRTATRRSGVFLPRSRALWGLKASKHESSPLGCQNPFQYTEVVQRKKNKNLQSRTFVPLFLFSNVLFGGPRWTEGLLYLGCDCSHITVSSAVSICSTFQTE